MISPILFGLTDNLEPQKNAFPEANAELKAEDFASFFNLSMFAPPLQNAVKLTENQTSSENEVASQSQVNAIISVTNVQITVNSLQIQDLSFQNTTQKPLLKAEFPFLEMKPEPNLIAVDTPLQTQENNLPTNLSDNQPQPQIIVDKQVAVDLLPMKSLEKEGVVINPDQSQANLEVNIPMVSQPLDSRSIDDLRGLSDSVNLSVFQVDNGDLLLDDNTGLVPENGKVPVTNPSPIGVVQTNPNPVNSDQFDAPIQAEPSILPPKQPIKVESEKISLKEFVLKKNPAKVEVVDTRKIRERIGLPKVNPEIKPIDTSTQDKTPTNISIQDKTPIDISTQDKTPKDTSIQDKTPIDTSIQDKISIDNSIQDKVETSAVDKQFETIFENQDFVGKAKTKGNSDNNLKPENPNISLPDDKKISENVRVNVSTQNQQNFSEKENEVTKITTDLEVSDKSFSEKLDSFPHTAIKVEKTGENDVQIKGLTAKVFEQIEPRLTETITSIRNNHDRKTLKLKLNPEELGKVEITLEKNADGKMNAHFQIESEKTRQILSENFTQLRNSLENNGQQVGKIEISYNSLSSNGNENRQNHSQQSANTENQFIAKNNLEDDSNLQKEEENRLVNLRA